MKAKFWQTNDFKTLEKEWYDRLEKEKFKDIEKESKNGERILKQRASNCYRNANETTRESKLLYYELLGDGFYRESEFLDSIEALIMQRRSEGVLIKHISQELKALGERNHRHTIWKIIKKYEKKWQIKKK